MAVLNVWNPLSEFTSMRDAMNRLFDQAYVRPAAADGGAAIPFDMVEQQDTLYVRAAVPGLDPESIQITVQQGVLTLTGRRALYTPEETKGYVWHVRSLSEGSIRLSTSLPFEVDAEQAQATYDNGIITVTLPKAEAVKPRVIQIKAGESQKALGAGASA
jgi:HSP20 family protein